MRSWMSLQAGFGDFQYRRNVYLFALRMSFVAVILSGVILTLTIPPLGFFGLLPMTLSHAIGFGAVFSWLVGGRVCGMLSLAAGFTMHELTLSRAEFEKLSRTDTLSGLLNRRAFTEALDKAEDTHLSFLTSTGSKRSTTVSATPAAMPSSPRSRPCSDPLSTKCPSLHGWVGRSLASSSPASWRRGCSASKGCEPGSQAALSRPTGTISASPFPAALPISLPGAASRRCMPRRTGRSISPRRSGAIAPCTKGKACIMPGTGSPITASMPRAGELRAQRDAGLRDIKVLT
ncbi:putative urease-associated protein [Rhizobium etli CNPAF512]|nr:putative urease-associated protein [Rhizobium etli CNPAF512]